MDRTVRAILGTKLGMTQVFDAQNRVVPVTVVRAGPCVVTRVCSPERDGYRAVQLAYGEIDPRRVSKPVAGAFAEAHVPPRKHLVEVRTLDAGGYQPGQEVTVAAFGDLLEAAGPDTLVRVDVTGTSKGKGTAGVMKRHNFHGLGAGHGTQRKHRAPGSIGACATPGRVFKGMRMAGRMGHVRTTTLNLTLHAVDAARDLLLIRGAVPGPVGGLVTVRTAVKGDPLETTA